MWLEFHSPAGIGDSLFVIGALEITPGDQQVCPRILGIFGCPFSNRRCRLEAVSNTELLTARIGLAASGI